MAWIEIIYSAFSNTSLCITYNFNVFCLFFFWFCCDFRRLVWWMDQTSRTHRGLYPVWSKKWHWMVISYLYAKLVHAFYNQDNSMKYLPGGVVTNLGIHALCDFTKGCFSEFCVSAPHCLKSGAGEISMRWTFHISGEFITGLEAQITVREHC